MGPVGRAFLAALLTATLMGCATDDADNSGETAAPPRSSATDEALPCVPGIEPFTGSAAEEFGAEEVMAAYCSLVDFSLDDGFTALMVADRDRRAADYAFVRPHLTPGARERWDALVSDYLATGDAAASRAIDGLTLHDVRAVPDRYRIPAGGPYSFGAKAGPARAQVVQRGDGRSRLELTFEVSTGVVLERKGDTSGRHSLLPVTKQVAYVVSPDGDDASRWRIHSWEGSWRAGDVALVGGG